MKPKVSIIILNWNGFDDTKECLESLKKVDYPNYEIMVIDNGSRDGSADKIRKEFPYVKLILNSENLGFAEGNNVGIREALKSDPNYVLLLNNDVIVDRKFLTELVKGAEYDPKIGMASPKIYYYDKPNIIWFAGAQFDRYSGTSPHTGRQKEDRGQYDGTRKCDRLSGACMLIKRAVIEKIGYLNEDYFRAAEDTEYSIRARKSGYEILFIPSSIIWHKVSSATGGEDSAQNIYYSNRNTMYLINEYYKYTLPLVLIRYYFKYLFMLLSGRKEKANATHDAILDFMAKKKGRSEKH
jgi:hypothetical protein